MENERTVNEYKHVYVDYHPENLEKRWRRKEGGKVALTGIIHASLSLSHYINPTCLSLTCLLANPSPVSHPVETVSFDSA